VRPQARRRLEGLDLHDPSLYRGADFVQVGGGCVSLRWLERREP
jgi:hypothetical protein